MGLLKLSIALIYVTSTLIRGYLCLISQSDKNSILKVHNEERAAVGVGPLRWNTTLEAYAAKVASKCTRTTDETKSPFGENASSPFTGKDGWAVAHDWAATSMDYIFANNTCWYGSHGCEYYTQMVWRKTRYIGCASAICPDYKYPFYVCKYYPRGNIPGERPFP